MPGRISRDKIKRKSVTRCSFAFRLVLVSQQREAFVCASSELGPTQTVLFKDPVRTAQ